MKDGLCGQHFPHDAVIAAVKKWVASASAEFYAGSGSTLAKMYSQWW
jgi:hypothetical protein